MKREGFDVARCTVARLMRRMGLEGAIRGKPIKTRRSDKAAPCPPLGLLAGQVDFSQLFIDLSADREFATLAAAGAAGVPTIAYGLFINTVVHFAAIAAVLFFVIRQINRVRSRIEAGEITPAPDTRACPYCLSTIPSAARRCPHCTSHLDEDAKG